MQNVALMQTLNQNSIIGGGQFVVTKYFLQKIVARRVNQAVSAKGNLPLHWHYHIICIPIKLTAV